MNNKYLLFNPEKFGQGDAAEDLFSCKVPAQRPDFLSVPRRV
jgi:hypothetical protein